MQTCSDDTNPQHLGPPGRLRRAGALAVGLMAACLLVAACSAPGQPQAQASSNPGRSSMLAYSKCMRSHGVPNFPDPNRNGGLGVDASKLGVDPASPQFQAADNACKSLMPQGGGHTPSPQDKAAMLKYAQCMRAHGIADFPDPGPEGLKVSAGPGSDLAPDNPQYQAADKACKQYMPGGGAGGSLSQNG